jgi:hypothetical protein
VTLTHINLIPPTKEPPDLPTSLIANWAIDIAVNIPNIGQGLDLLSLEAKEILLCILCNILVVAGVYLRSICSFLIVLASEACLVSPSFLSFVSQALTAGSALVGGRLARRTLQRMTKSSSAGCGISGARGVCGGGEPGVVVGAGGGHRW